MALFHTRLRSLSLGIVSSLVVVNILLSGHGVESNVIVRDLDSNETAAIFPDLQATFGPDFPKKGLKGRVVLAHPKTACGYQIDGPPDKIDEYPWIVLIERGGCEFVNKVFNAQMANFSAVIVYNLPGNQALTRMGGDNGTDIKIPSTFVGYNTGMDLKSQYSYPRFKEFMVEVKEEEEVDYRMYLLPFAIVVGACFFMVMVFLIVKFIRDHTRTRTSRLSKKHLKKIPIRKFKKGQYYDTCAICLEEYEDGEKIRVLPCEHAYHAKCIDPWLTRNKKTCPVCKRRVIPGDDPNSEDSDSDSEEGGTGGASLTTPLLMSAGSQRSHGSMNHADGDSGPHPRAQSAPPLFETTVVLETEGAVGGVGISQLTSEGGTSSASNGGGSRSRLRAEHEDLERGEQREGKRKRKSRRGGDGGEQQEEEEGRLLLGTEEDEEEEERRKAERKERRKKKKEKKKNKSKKSSSNSGGGDVRDGVPESDLLDNNNGCPPPSLENVDDVVVLNNPAAGSRSSRRGGDRVSRQPIVNIAPVTEEEDYGVVEGAGAGGGAGGGSGRVGSGAGDVVPAANTTETGTAGLVNNAFSDSQEEVVVPSTRRGKKREMSEVV